MAKVPTTQLTLKNLRERGYTAEVVERFNSFTKHRKDFLNIIDIIAIKPGEILGVQTTTYKAASEHRKKIRLEPLLKEWLSAGGKFELQQWLKPKFRYEIRIETFDS